MGAGKEGITDVGQVFDYVGSVSLCWSQSSDLKKNVSTSILNTSSELNSTTLCGREFQRFTT